MDSDKLVKDVVNQVREHTNSKKDLAKRIDDLNNKIGQRDTRLKKCDDDLVEYRQNKHFLDVLAIQAGKKLYNPKAQTAPVVEEEVPGTSKSSGKRAPTAAESTFLTGV